MFVSQAFSGDGLEEQEETDLSLEMDQVCQVQCLPACGEMLVFFVVWQMESFRHDQLLLPSNLYVESIVNTPFKSVQ